MNVIDWLELLASIVGAISGVAALLVWLFGVGRKVGQLESRLQTLERDGIDPREWGELRNQVKTMYSIYVEHVVRQNMPPTGRGGRDDR